MGLEEIDVQEFCEKVSLECIGAEVVPEQVLEALGGLSNLYLEAVLNLGEVKLEVKTWEAFACEYIKLDHIIKEIGNCAGTDEERSSIVLRKMQKVLRDNFKRREIYGPGRPLLLKPLGKLEVIDLEASAYFLKYVDPAAKNYFGLILE